MTILLNGEPCEAIRVRVTQRDEKIDTYLLDDGHVVSVRCILTGIWRLKDKVDQHGQPAYHLNWHVVAIVEAKEEDAP